MNHLLRELAPLTSEAWDLLDSEATARLSAVLGARKLVDFVGPLGWQHSATSTGRVGAVVSAPAAGVIARPRVVLPLAEVRADFSVPRAELGAAARGAVDVDLSALDAAALSIASVENAAVFHGWQELGMTGIVAGSPHQPIATGDDPSRYALRVAAAIASLKRAGVGGPYGLALDYDTWVNVTGGNDAGGAPLLTHVQRVLDGGPIEWAPGIDSPVVLSLRGGDFILESGEDLSIGYSAHTSESVDLYLVETFSFRVATPEAAIVLA
ncbi:MAG TPA: family 1 encapsulin nanocompartment shell protein [Microbacteriaceae bacterium]